MALVLGTQKLPENYTCFQGKKYVAWCVLWDVGFSTATMVIYCVNSREKIVYY